MVLIGVGDIVVVTNPLAQDVAAAAAAAAAAASLFFLALRFSARLAKKDGDLVRDGVALVDNDGGVAGQLLSADSSLALLGCRVAVVVQEVVVDEFAAELLVERIS